MRGAVGHGLVDIDLGRPDAGGACGNAEIAHQSQLEARANDHAVNGRDGGLGQGADQRPGRGQLVQKRPEVIQTCVLHGADIGAGTKSPTRAGKDHRPHLGILLRVGTGLPETPDQRG